MGSDASIYNMIRAPQQGPGPLDQYSAMMQLRALGDSSQLHALQRRKMEGDMAEEEAFKGALAKLSDFTKPLGADVYATSPTRAAAFEKTRLEGEKTRGEIDKNKIELHGKQVQQLRDQLAAVADDNGLAMLRENTMKLYGPNAVAKMPQTVTDPAFGDWQRSQLLTADKFIEQTTPKMEKVDIGGKIMMVDTNPVTNPAIKGMNYTKTATPGEVLTDTRTRLEGVANRDVTRRGQDLTNKRAVEANTISAATAGLNQQRLTNELNQTRSGAEGTISTLDTALGTLDTLEKHPGFTQTVGAALIPGQRFIPGTDAAGFDAQLETFKAQTFLPMVEKLKGMGALSDAEGKKLSAAVGALNISMPEAEFKASMAQIRKDLEGAKARAKANVERMPKPAANGKIGGVLTQNQDGSFNYGAPQ